MKFKGHARIELTNVNTGKKEIVEHDNMITDAVYDLCNPVYPLLPTALNIPAIRYDNLPLVESIFGGLMLWEDALNEDATDYVFPHGVGCTGYACNKANGGTNNMMGTYNASESGYQGDGSHKKVWDFTTNQANGTIASLSLVPVMAGNLGWGVSESEYDSSLKEEKKGMVQCDFLNGNYVDYNLFIKDGYLYAVKQYNVIYNSSYQAQHLSRNGGKLIIQKILLPAKNISLFGNYSYAKVVEEFEVQLPTAFVESISTTESQYYGICVYDDRTETINIIMQRYYVESGDSIKLCRINISDYTSTIYEITAPFKITLNNMKVDGYSYFQYAAISGNKLIVSSYDDYKIAIIDIDNVSNIKELESPSNTRMVFGDMQNGYLYLSVMSGSYADVNKIYILDVDSGDLKRLTTFNWQYNTSDRLPLFNRCIMGTRIIGSKIHSIGYNNYLYPFYHIMMTKNNLDAPVTKTADKTMKIIYTITET